MPGPRHRSRGVTVTNGTSHHWFWGYGGGNPIVQSYESCDDDTSFGDCNAFHVNRMEQVGGRLNGSFYDEYGGYIAKFDNYRTEGCNNTALFDHINVEGEPDIGMLSAQCAMRSNPSKPYVDLPVTILQLGEVTRLVRDTGKTLIERYARKHIEMEFGVKPLASDIVKIMNMQDQINRRIKQIQKLSGSTGYRRTMDLWTGTSPVQEKLIVYQSIPVWVSALSRGTTQVKIRGHARWYPTVDMTPYLGEGPLRDLAMKALLGLTVDFKTVWEMIPWTWLIDWATNIGDLLAAQRNIVPAQLQGLSIMKHTQTKWVASGHVGGGYRGQQPFMHGLTRETKSRFAGSLTPSIHLPFLTGSQVGILGSLSVLKAPREYRALLR